MAFSCPSQFLEGNCTYHMSIVVLYQLLVITHTRHSLSTDPLEKQVVTLAIYNLTAVLL